MTNELKQHLEENPHIANVYVNAKKQWQFYPKPGYDKVLTRDEVLKMKVASNTAEYDNKPALSRGTGTISDAAQHKAHELTEAQKAWLAKMPTEDQPYSEQPDGKVDGPDLDNDGLIDGAGSDVKRKVEEKITHKEDKK